MKNRVQLKIALSILLLLTCGTLGYAQTDLATIGGTVLDSTGARVSGGRVEAKNLDTSATRNTLTNAEGNYSLPSLPVGNYEVTVSAPGFRAATTRVGLSLSGATLNFNLRVGTAAQQVTVTGSDEAQLKLSSHELSQTVGRAQLVNLPNSGRNFINIATLGPYSQPGTDTSANKGDVAWFNQTDHTAYIAGLDNYHTLFLQDGVENISLIDQAANLVNSIEGIQEVQTTTNGADARYQAPSVINVITRSGTNQFHGTAYDFLQNDALNARNWYATSKPRQRYNLFGANFGGPIIRNKLFAFFDYSGMRNPATGVSENRVPTVAERNGDLSADTPQIYDPATYDPVTGTTSPFAGNIIPSDRIDNFAKLWLGNFPLPNTPLGDNNVNYITNLPSQNRFDKYQARVDWNISDKNQLSGSFSKADPFNGGTSITPGQFGLTFDNHSTNVNIEETATFSPDLVNVAKFGYNHSTVARTPQGVGEKDYSSYYGIGGLNMVPSQWSPPQVIIFGFPALGDCCSPQTADQNRFQFADEVNWVRGKHHLFFGGQFVLTHFYGLWVVQNNGQFVFAGNATGQYTNGQVTAGGNPTADFLLGLPQTAVGAIGRSAAPFRSNGGAIYIQDNWKPTPTLTLNIGLRYDLNQAPQDTTNHNGLFQVATASVIPGSYDTNYGDIGPRFGFAWNFAPRTVLRGGYGIYYGGNEWEDLQFQLMYPPNFINKSYLFDINNQLTVENAVAEAPSATAPGNSFSMEKHFPDPSMQEWNLNIERALPWNTLFTIAYQGNVSHHVEARADLNEPYALSPGNTSGILDLRRNSAINGVLSHGPYAYANYNALGVTLHKRFQKGVQFLASYTWSKAMNLVDGDNPTIPDTYHPREAYAIAGWDRTHNFILSGIYELPFGTGRTFASSNNWFNKRVIGGWQLSGIQRVTTGEPISITAINNATTSPYGVNYANISCNPNEGFQHTRFHVFNGDCFTQPANGSFGYGGRSAVREPKVVPTDLSLAKVFEITERQHIRFQADAFSALNHPHFVAGGGNAGTPGLGQVYGSGGERSMQLALRYSF